MRSRLSLALLLLLPALPARAHDWMRPPLFPEQPSLDALAPRVAPMFVQETWSRGQHCREWGFHVSREEIVRRDLREAMQSMGLGEPEALYRHNGIAMSIGTMPLDTVDDSLQSFKITICTEANADDASYRRFTAQMQQNSLYPRLPLGPPDLIWIRRYANGVDALGMRFPIADESLAISALTPLGYAEVQRDVSIVELRNGSARARFLGEVMWWQTETGSIGELAR